jgi:hypothetical protein
MNVGTRAVRATHHESSILPKSNPFTIPAASLLGTLGPTLRFLMLVALFTMAGMILLSNRDQDNLPTSDAVPADSVTLRPSLEPATTAVDISRPTPTATGPASAPITIADQKHVDDRNAHDLNEAEEDEDFEADDEIDDIHVQRQTPDATNSPYPQTAWPPASMPWTDQDHLPQARMTDPALPIALLPGYITELAPRQASHDDDQPSLH